MSARNNDSESEYSECILEYTRILEACVCVVQGLVR
jgi:hypothetical protein